jgi:4-oxalmesaconate hydratase
VIIDVHGHYTTEPNQLFQWRDKQLSALAEPARKPSPKDLKISDDELIESVQIQLQYQRERGSDMTLFSPRAAGMAHHIGSEAISQEWTRLSNDLVHRICTLLPDNFAPVGQLPQFVGVSPTNSIAELERLAELGFVAVNLNPDPAGGYWTDPPMTDRYWYPLYEKLVELRMTAMIHVSSSRNKAFHYTGAHYINADTTVFMQLLEGDLFKDFPELKFVIPHGGGGVPFHWGRYRGLAQMQNKPELEDHLLKNVFFDTCVYHLPGMRLLTEVVPLENLMFASEMLGAVKGIDPRTGHYFDDTKRYLDQIERFSEAERYALFEGNARRIYPRLDDRLKARQPAATAGISRGGMQ